MDTSPETAADRSRERLTQDLLQVLADARQLLGEVTRGDAEQGSTATPCEGQAQRARDELQRLEALAAVAGKRAVRASDQAVREYPYAAMGIAAGLGLLVGMLVARR